LSNQYRLRGIIFTHEIAAKHIGQYLGEKLTNEYGVENFIVARSYIERIIKGECEDELVWQKDGFISSSPAPEKEVSIKCSCNFDDILINGCKCGGK
jgi:hypothetical protein